MIPSTVVYIRRSSSPPLWRGNPELRESGLPAEIARTPFRARLAQAERDDSGGVQNVRVALSGYARVRSARPPVVAQVGWTEAEEMFPEVDRFLLRLRGTLQEFVAGAGRCRTCPAPLVLRLAGHAVAVTNGYGADLSGPSVHARADRGG
jgi:hypothetical protein